MQEKTVSQYSAETHGETLADKSNENGLFDFSNLPMVVFLKILKSLEKTELCRLSLVNKSWRKACLDPCLWRNLDLRKYSTISDDDLIRLTSYSNTVNLLRISEVPLLGDSGLSCALTQCLSLTECSFFNCRQLSDKVLETLGEYCREIKKLDVTLCLGFTDEGLKKVCQGCPNLEHLVIDQCANLTNELLVHVGKYCKILKHISAMSIVNITDEGVLSLLQGCRKLQVLNLPFCGLTNHSFTHISQHGLDIVYLDVRGIKLEDSHIHNLVKSLTKIETLNLGLCFNLTDMAVTEIAMNFKKIKHLILVNTKITDKGLFELSVHSSRNLVHLDVSWCKEVTMLGARKILTSCPNLKHLGLFQCDKLSETAVNELCVEFPHVFISTFHTEMEKSRSLSRKQVDS